MMVDALFAELVKEDNDIVANRANRTLPIKRAIFVDSTWHQTKAIYKDQRLRGVYLYEESC